MDFYDRVGIVALGSRLRRLGERMAEEATQIYPVYGTQLQPRWFPVLHILSEAQEESVSSIAERIGHSHASVSQIVGEMARQGYVAVKKRKQDGRKSFVVLSAKGRSAVAKMQDQYADVRAAVAKLLGETKENLWQALGDCETALTREPLHRRVAAERKMRESAKVKIVDYSPKHARAFKALNEEWIRRHFALEDADRKALNDPEGYVLEAGGHILVAVEAARTLGVCALLKRDAGTFELAKMAVAPEARSKGIGLLLGQAALQRARQAGARRVYLESNTVLEPALGLYRKLGFTPVEGGPSPYARCNVQMEKWL